MGKKSDPPPGPDYKALLALTDKYAKKNDKLQREYLKFQESSYADQKAISDQINAIQLPAMEDEAAMSQQMRDRYREMGIPFEDEYLDTITNWDSEERRDNRAGQAQAGVGMASDAAREAEIRKLESYGIDPSQTRSAALDSNLRFQEAVSKAAAGNNERNAVEREGISLGGEAVNIYKGMPAQSAQSLATATGAGQTAFGNSNALGNFGTQGYMNASNMNASNANMYNSAYNTSGSLYANDLNKWELEQKYSTGAAIGKLAGTALGAASGAGGFGGLFSAEGGPVPHAAEGGPPQIGQPQPQQGGQPQQMAAPRPQSQGIPSDNEPIMVTPGEFIIPDDVARWEGEKSLQKMINKARDDRTTTEQQRAQNQQSLGIPA